MKRLIYSLLLLLICLMSAQAQVEGSSNEDDTVYRFLKEELKINEGKYINQPLSKLYHLLSGDCPYTIKHMSTMSFGGWSSPDGTEYMTGVTLYNLTSDEMETNNIVYIIDVSLDIFIDDDKFWQSLPDDGWMEAMQERTKNLKVTDIKIQKTRLYGKGTTILGIFDDIVLDI